MFPVNLTRIKTKDGISLEGITVLPERKNKKALIWLHGLSSRFSSSQTRAREISEACRKTGIGFFSFNNRGHDVADMEEIGLVGAGFEKFTDCILDIRAMILLSRKSGFSEIILAGHSTGANKALYYVYKTKDRAVKKLILIGPISDIAGEMKKIGKRELALRVRIAEKLKGKDRRAMMPLKYGLFSAERYLSLFRPGSAEDMFPYHNPRAKWKELRSVKIPLAVIVGKKDEYLDRPAAELMDIFAEKSLLAKSFSGIIIKGANHGFRKKEKELAEKIMEFIKRKPY